MYHLTLQNVPMMVGIVAVKCAMWILPTSAAQNHQSMDHLDSFASTQPSMRSIDPVVCTVSDRTKVGDGLCDAGGVEMYNTEACNWDGGDW